MSLQLNHYQLSGEWCVLGRIDEVYDVLINTAEYARWWPSVFRKVIEVQPGDAYGVDRVDVLETRGWLPGLLHWQTSVEEADRPASILLQTWGDFVGTIEWRLTQEGAWAEVAYDWRLELSQPLLRRLSPLVHPLAAANLRWALERGEESLRLELAHRQAANAVERAALPAPPPPTSLPMVPIVAGLGLLAAVVLYRASSNSKEPSYRQSGRR